MAEVTKSTAKLSGMAKDQSHPPAEAMEGSKPPMVPKAKKAGAKMRKAGAVKPKSASQPPGSGKKTIKKEKQKKIKMVRDSFTMPENDYAKIAELKKKCLMAGEHVKKSELLRAGLTYLTKLSKPDLLKSVKQVEKIKTGRPAKKHR